ncbi:MAG: methyltransferase [Pseudomonadota bacterium]
MSADGTLGDTDLTRDEFLGGRATLLQPRNGYRAGTDPVFLAAAVAAKPGDRVLDVGCGAGGASACLSARIDGLAIHGLEAQGTYAALARRNLPGATVWEGDLFEPPAGLKDVSFDWAMTNPPFFDAADIASPDVGRDRARRETADARDWIAACLKRVRGGGRIAVFHQASRVPEIISGLNGAGDIAVLPLQSRAGREAKRVIVTARKGAKGPFRLLPSLTIHAGARHERDGDDYTEAAKAVLRDAAALPGCG